MSLTFDPDRLVEMRKRAGLTQQGLADAVEVSQQAVSEWERGRKHPEINKLTKLAEVLGCDLGELFSVRPAA